MAFELPSRGFVFWPVGTGDSTTIIIKENEIVMQVDLHHLAKADDDDTPHTAIVDELVRLLPKKNGKPYLSVFALTHPDKDHVLGFSELLKKVQIGEIWHTPRIFQEYKCDLCDDAVKFKEEVERRREATIKAAGDPKAGDRVRVIGHDIAAEDEAYKTFPEEWHSYPGDSITSLDGTDYSDVFEAFVHAPFKEDIAAERNDTSLALQITLHCGDQVAKALLFGDREYPTTKQIFDVTKEHKRDEYVEWNILLAPHHCSKCVMYWKDDPEGEETYKSDIMEEFEEAGLDVRYVVVSADSDFSDKEGKNPPHLKARNRYEELVESGNFLCTHEYPSVDSPEPIKFEISENGLELVKSTTDKAQKAARTTVAVAAARGGEAPPTRQVGFGKFFEK
jgi:hypothetical protein